jgi:hypothetical protein
VIDSLNATNFAFILACVTLPIVWGAVVHGLFHAWHERQERRRPAPIAATSVELEAEERELP